MTLTDNSRGAIFMSVAMVAFVANDALMKVTFETMPLAQGVFARGLVATALVAVLAWRAGALAFRPNRREVGALAIRSAGEIGGTVTFTIALANVPIATAMAVLQAAPLAVTMGAAVFLAEPVGWRRWSAISVGFVGVLVMVRPGMEGFDAYTLLPVLTVGCIVVRDIATRKMSANTPTLFASTVTAAVIALTALLVMPFEGIRAPGGRATLLYAGAGVFIVIGYVLHVMAMRLGDISAVSPFRYTVLVHALAIGYLVFGDVPDASTLVGAGIVVMAGLYTLWREQRIGRTRPAAHSLQRPFGGTERPTDDT